MSEDETDVFRGVYWRPFLRRGLSYIVDAIRENERVKLIKIKIRSVRSHLMDREIIIGDQTKINESRGFYAPLQTISFDLGYTVEDLRRELDRMEMRTGDPTFLDRMYVEEAHLLDMETMRAIVFMAQHKAEHPTVKEMLLNSGRRFTKPMDYCPFFYEVKVTSEGRFRYVEKRTVSPIEMTIPRFTEEIPNIMDLWNGADSALVVRKCSMISKLERKAETTECELVRPTG